MAGSRAYSDEMADVIEGGPPRPPRRWHRAALGLAALVVAGWAILHGGTPPGPPAAAPSPVPSVRDFSGPARPADAQGRTWPTRDGACGSVARLPLTKTPRPAWLPDTRLLVGGSGARIVDAATGATVPVAGLPSDGEVTGLLGGRHGRYAVLTRACHYDHVSLYRLRGRTAERVPLRPHAGATVVEGAHGLWQVPETADPGSPGGIVVRSVTGHRTVRLPATARLVADTTAGLVVELGTGPNGSPRVAVFDTTGRRLRGLGAGSALAATREGRVVMTVGRCDFDATAPCRLRRVEASTGAVTGRYVLPARRTVMSQVALDAGGRFAAFALQRPHVSPRYASDHPFPPSDVATLDLRTGTLRIVPELELAAKTVVGLAWDGGGAWLFVTTDEGDRVRVLAWQRPMAGPVPVADLPGAVTAGPPVLPVPLAVGGVSPR